MATQSQQAEVIPDDKKPTNVPGKQQGKQNFPRPKNNKGKSLPGPSKKSTTETPLTNDLIWKDAFVIDGETGFVSEQAAKEFHPDAAGYVQLVEAEYKAISDVDKYYAKSIPAGAHAYFHLILYWYRLATIAQKRGVSSHDQDRLVRFVQGYPSLEIAAGAADYLEGLGDYTDTTGVKHLLSVMEPNAQGHFGRATADNHGLYETLPAPAIFYRRVQEDLLASTRGNQVSDDWIDEAIVPRPPRPAAAQDEAPGPSHRARRNKRREDELGGEDADVEGGCELPPAPAVEEAHIQVLPTVNLLGWRPSRSMNAYQTMELQDLVREDSVIIQRYALNRELFELVERRVRECKRYKLAKVPNTTSGSLVQQVTWKPVEFTTSRFRQFIEMTGVAATRMTLPVRAAICAKIMCYRSIRAELDDEDDRPMNTWSCFKFPEQVPQTWINNRNVRIQHGNDGLINYAPFKTQVTPRSDTLLEYLTKFKAK